MTQKKRVYDLAKEYGMTGQELAKKLRELGFTQVKSHMTALGEAEMLEMQARLEAYGYVDTKAPESADAGGGLVVKRKKKKKPATRAAEPAPVEEAEEPGAPEEAPVEVPLGETEPEPVAEAEAPTPEEVETIEPPRADEPPREPETPPVQAPEPEPVETVAEAPAEPPAAAEAAQEAEVAAPSAELEAAEEEAGEEYVEGDDKIVRPSDTRRPGKIVGFVDLSKMQSTAPRRPESRRLRSSDEDVAPEVQPTLGQDRRRAFQRGDHAGRGQLTAAQLREREAGRFLRRQRTAQRAAERRRTGATRPAPDTRGSPYAGQKVRIEEPVSIRKLANSLSVKENDVLRVAMRLLGFGAVNINSLIDEDTAVLLAQEFDVEVRIQKEVEAEEALLSQLAEDRARVAEAELIVRPPTVAFLGHVDHGKTTLIDSIRLSRIAASEDGGITQHIGAYQVQTKKGHTITIVDTPGHEAFTAMRARGAKAVDVAVLVVAADDGVMPQTLEAMNHARAAGTPIVVAINKCDKPEAHPDKVMNELSGHGLTPEDWGGETAMLKVSGLKNEGVEELLERVFLESELLEDRLKSHPHGPARGVVLEAEIQQGKGKVAHLLVQDGGLKTGDVILAGEGYGRVRSIHDDRGRALGEAGPALPVEVTGLSELPGVGDEFHVVESLDSAREVAEERGRKARQLSQIERRSVTRENLLEAVAAQDRAVIRLIVKGDRLGSVQTLRQQLEALDHAEVSVRVIDASVGQVSQSDVDLATTSDAIILAFRVGADAKSRQAAERAGVELRSFDVIYELLDHVRARMETSLAPEITEQVTAHIEIRRIFRSSRLGNIAGCYVLDGTAVRDNRARLLRDGQVVWTGSLASLRREKDDVKEVREGFECGIVLRDYNDIKEGDVVETFRMVEQKRQLQI